MYYDKKPRGVDWKIIQEKQPFSDVTIKALSVFLHCKSGGFAAKRSYFLQETDRYGTTWKRYLTKHALLAAFRYSHATK